MWDFVFFVWYISIVHLFSSVNIMFSKSFEVHSFLHLFSRQKFLKWSVRSVFQTYKIGSLERKQCHRLILLHFFYYSEHLCPLLNFHSGWSGSDRRSCGAEAVWVAAWCSCCHVAGDEETRTLGSGKESLWGCLYHRFPFRSAETFRSWKCRTLLVRRVGFD